MQLRWLSENLSSPAIVMEMLISFSCFYCPLLTFISLLKKSFRNTFRVIWFGSESGPMFRQSLSWSKLFADDKGSY